MAGAPDGRRYRWSVARPTGNSLYSSCSPQAHRADVSDMAPELCLTCVACGRRFASSLQMDPPTFEKIRITNQIECCRLCSATHRYRKSDYYFVGYWDTEAEA